MKDAPFTFICYELFQELGTKTKYYNKGCFYCLGIDKDFRALCQEWGQRPDTYFLLCTTACHQENEQSLSEKPDRRSWRAGA